MVEKRQIYKCLTCGNIVEVLEAGGGELVCCGEPMKLMAENTVDASKEKHVPVIEKSPEGWWVTGPTECKTIYSGDLDARYYYVFAADDIGGGSWDGEVYMCTRDESFTIFGVEDCLARGYERTGFFEVDTQNRSNWMLQLTETEVLGAEPVDGTGDEAPLEGDLGASSGDDQPTLDENPDGEGATAQ